MVILLLCSLCLSEQAVLGGGDLDTQAFPAPGAGQDGAELAALALLQYGLAGDAGALAGVAEGDPAVGVAVREPPRPLPAEPAPPRGAGGDTLPADAPAALREHQ